MKHREKRTRDLVIGAVVALSLFYWTGVFNLPLLRVETREPAAIPPGSPFDGYGSDLSNNRKIIAGALLKNALLEEENNSLKLALNNTAFNNGKYLCDLYDRIELSFEAEGIATNGDRPKLVVVAPCEVSPKSSLLKPIYIPYLELRRMPATDGEMSFGQYSDHAYYAFNMPGVWPDYWVLSELRAFNKNDSSSSLKFDKREVYSAMSSPIILKW